MNSNSEVTRQFADAEAVRTGAVPVIVSIVGPSGTGKTFSALRLVTGIQRVMGGDVWLIDTEANRALHYAPKKGEAADPARGTFKFRHLPLVAPFSSLDYLAAVEHCVAKGAKTVIIDSLSHEHEGEGGYLEQHAAEMTRIAAAWRVPEAKAQVPAWGAPKSKRTRFINSMLQMPVNFVFCFRAQEKIRLPKTGEADREVKGLGFMAIGGARFLFESTVGCLLLPGADGVPSWHPQEMGEKMTIKLPIQFRREFFPDGQPLSEEIGEKLARWAAGDAAGTGTKPSAAVITVDQLTILADDLDMNGVTAEEVKAALKVTALAQVPAADFEKCRAWIVKKGAAKIAAKK